MKYKNYRICSSEFSRNPEFYEISRKTRFSGFPGGSRITQEKSRFSGKSGFFGFSRIPGTRKNRSKKKGKGKTPTPVRADFREKSRFLGYFPDPYKMLKISEMPIFLEYLLLSA